MSKFIKVSRNYVTCMTRVHFGDWFSIGIEDTLLCKLPNFVQERLRKAWPPSTPPLSPNTFLGSVYGGALPQSIPPVQSSYAGTTAHMSTTFPSHRIVRVSSEDVVEVLDVDEPPPPPRPSPRRRAAVAATKSDAKK